jgi:predicted regulator of Ras-like GTPase activity (Roadblock/LC7/MglB family)
MDAASALADLTEISSQVDAAVVFAADGAVAASTFADEGRTEKLARVGRSLLEEAERVPTGRERKLTRVEVVLPEGNVFVARGSGSSIVATTSPTPASRLVFHDLETCLGAVAEAVEQPAPPKPRRSRKKPVDA